MAFLLPASSGWGDIREIREIKGFKEFREVPERLVASELNSLNSLNSLFLRCISPLTENPPHALPRGQIRGLPGERYVCRP